MRNGASAGSLPTSTVVGETRPIERDSVSGRAMLDRQVVILDDTRWSDGIRTVIGVPLLRKGLAVGAFTVYRTQERPFSDGERTSWSRGGICCP